MIPAPASPAGPAAKALPLTAADGPALAAIEARVAPLPWDGPRLGQELALGGRGWQVVGAEGRMWGYLVIRPQWDEWHVMTIGVLPQRQRQGVGRRLMATLEAEARAAGVARLLLEVRADNAPARGLYRAMGFREVGRRRGYYPGPPAPEDGVVMIRELAGDDGEQHAE